MVMSRRQHPLIWIAALLALAIGAFWQQRNRSEDPETSQQTTQAQNPTPAQNGREKVRPAEESMELQKTLALIARGGPFPYRNDGAVFANREGRLPQREPGYYREYTVVTPGAKDRGARRVVRGNGGELYYTRDHYRTFLRFD